MQAQKIRSLYICVIFNIFSVVLKGFKFQMSFQRVGLLMLHFQNH